MKNHLLLKSTFGIAHSGAVTSMLKLNADSARNRFCRPVGHFTLDLENIASTWK
jgi:hypothetical protein